MKRSLSGPNSSQADIVAPRARHSLDLAAIRETIAQPDPAEDSNQKKSRRTMKISFRTWMKKKHPKPYPLLNSLLPSSEESASLEAEAETALNVILTSPKLKDNFLLFLEDRLQKYRFLFALDVRQFKSQDAGVLIGRAHLLYQKYLVPDALYDIGLESTYGEVIYEALWAHPEGLDPEGLVTHQLFDAALQSVLTELEPAAEAFLLQLSGSTEGSEWDSSRSLSPMRRASPRKHISDKKSVSLY
jgi:Asp-tRNA(Asn)/Glu-tRNA(Gln) amidotransferase A subunit family amidase